MSRQLEAWREIAYRDNSAEMLSMSRPLLRELFDEMDARTRRAEAARAVAEADADRLAHHLHQLCHEMYVERYEPNRPCRGCYQAVYDHDEAVAQR